MRALSRALIKKEGFFMKIMSFIKKISIGFLLLPRQTQAVLLNDEAAHCEGEVFNPCEPFGFHDCWNFVALGL